MPNHAEAVAGVRFEVQDESAIEKARHILEELCFKEEILQGTRRTKQHSSMLAYTAHVQKIKRNRSNLGKLNRKSNKGNPMYPIMQFDNRLALSGGAPASNQLPTEHLKESQFALTRSHNSKPDKKFQDRLPVTENITWVPATTLNHYSVTCTSCIQCQEEQQQKQNRVKRIAVLKSNDETVYANYNVSDSGTTGGQQTTFGETAAETESLLEQDATGDSLIHENRDDVKQVGAYIILNEPDEFHPGILPRPGNGGIGKLTPRFTLDVTLPRMEADEHVCLSPCSEQDEEYHEDDIVNGVNSQQTGMGGITKQDTSDSMQDLSDDAKPEQLRYPTSHDKHVTVPECPQQNALSGNTSVDKEEPTSASKDTGVSDPNNSLSTRDKYVLHDQAQVKSGSGSVTFQPNGKPQKRSYSMRKTLALRMAKPNTSSSKFLEKYAKYNAQLQASEDKIETFSGLFSDIKRDPNTPPTSPEDNEFSSSGLTLRSILKPPALNPDNTVEHQDVAHSKPNLGTSTHLKVKPEAQFRVRKVPQNKQADKQGSVKKAKDAKTKRKKDDSSLRHKDRKPVQVDFADNLTPESYHKAYTVNNKPLPTHMKRILENAMESVPKSSGRDSSKNVSRKEQKNVNVNQACEILDDIVDFHTKRRDNGKVCRHGMFLSNCSVCIALEDIQQRIKFNIKKHVKNKFQWNLLPGMQCEETKWTSYAPTAPLSDSNAGKKGVKLPAIKSTISVSEFRIIRRRKLEQSDTKTTQNSESGEIRQPPIKTILFDDMNELETPLESGNERLTLSQNPRGRKKVTFAEKNIYRPIIGYKMRLGETVDKGIMDF